jgi:hypothetical protein
LVHGAAAFGRVPCEREKSMSAVIEFPANRIGQMTRSETSATADVIIFPGVRIERPDVQAAERQTPSKPRSAR